MREGFVRDVANPSAACRKGKMKGQMRVHSAKKRAKRAVNNVVSAAYKGKYFP